MITSMGSWGPGLFDDDFACDIRDEYEKMLRNKVPDDDAERTVSEGYKSADDIDIMWLALAVTESAVGRLSELAKTKALDAIDSGRLMALYVDLVGKNPESRKKALEGARTKLTGPQRKPKIMRKKWRHVTDLKPGDILTLTEDGWTAAMIVLDIDDHESGVAPFLLLWQWAGPVLPADDKLESLPILLDRSHREGFKVPALHRPAVHSKAWPDWRDVGFVLDHTIEVEKPDPKNVVKTYTTWDGMSATIRWIIEGRQGGPSVA